MRIATRLRINALMFAGIVFAISLIFVVAFQMQKSAFKRAIFADSLMRGSYELNSLSTRYLKNPEARPREQWSLLHSSLLEELERGKALRREQPEIMGRIRHNLDEMKLLFDNFVSVRDEERGSAASSPVVVNQRTLVANLLTKRSRELSLDAGRLVSINNRAVGRINRRIIFLIPVVGLALAGITFWTSMRISRSITVPVAKLRSGVEALGSGDLDYRIGNLSDDELGRLASAFDEMAGNLKSITVSRDELMKEIAERTSAEKSLRESEERFRATYEQAAIGIEMVDLGGHYIRGNGKLSQMLGYSEDELQQLGFSSITHPDDLARELPLIDRLIAGEIPSYTIEKRYINKMGRDFWVRVTSSIARTSAPYRISVIEDITERKKAEEQLKKLLAELARSNKELEQFAYVASHDLQEPLRMVSSYVQLLARKYSGQLDDQAEKYVDFAVDGAERMQKLIEGLLSYSRISRGRSEFGSVDMNSVCDAALSNVSAAIREAGASLSRGELPRVQGDETQLIQLLQNLIANAVKFRKPDSRPEITVRAEPGGGEWVFSVADNGIGIEPEYFGKIFLIFQRLHTRREYPGTGIGLALCKKIVERHNGRIWVESVPGSGTTFFFTLPKEAYYEKGNG